MRYLLSLLILVTACTGTPVPEPPNLRPPDPSLINVEVGSAPGISGQPGAVAPGAELWITNLDSVDPPLRIATADDGSFRSEVYVASPGEELRLQARRGDERSEPVDVLAGGDEIARPTAGCLGLTPALELDLDAPETQSRIVVSNSCGAEARIEQVRLRAPSTLLRLDSVAPLIVADGESAQIDVTLLPGATGLTEEVVILDVSAPEVDRRPITVFARRP